MPPSHPLNLPQAVRDLTTRANPVVGWLQAHHIHTAEGRIEQNQVTPAGERLVNAGRGPRARPKYTRVFCSFNELCIAPRRGAPQPYGIPSGAPGHDEFEIDRFEK